MRLICVWRPAKNRETGEIVKWELMVRFGHGDRRRVAIVYPDGAWQTFGQYESVGSSGSAPTIEDARVQAAGHAVLQGFI